MGVLLATGHGASLGALLKAQGVQLPGVQPPGVQPPVGQQLGAQQFAQPPPLEGPVPKRPKI